MEKKYNFYLIIFELLKQEKTPLQISKDLGISKQRLNYHFKNLEKEGYILKEKYGKYTLTDKGNNPNRVKSILNEDDFKNFVLKLGEPLYNKKRINFDKLQDISIYILNYCKNENIKWEDVSLIGNCLISLSLQSGIDGIKLNDKNSISLKNLLELQRKKIDDEIMNTRLLLDLFASYNYFNTSIENINIFNNKFISLNLKERFNILEKFGYKCVYCGRSPPEVTLQLEHINPKSKGGINDDLNFVPACRDCNLGKRDKILKKFPKKVCNGKSVQSI